MVVRSILFAVLLVAGSAATAAAQSVTEVPTGSAFDVQNGTECAPNAQVELLFEQAADAVPIGSTIADAAGHFEYSATLPGSASQGVAQVTATCGLEDQVLVFDVVVVAATNDGILGFSPLALASMAGLVVLIAALVWRARSDGSGAEGDEDASDDSTAEAVDIAAGVTAEAVDMAAGVKTADDGARELEPDYWFWDAETPRGPVKRIACLSRQGFYLHEAAQDDFGALLESLSTDGPDQVFASSFVAIEIASIDQVQRRGTQLRVVYRHGTERLARVIDIGAQVDGVVDLLGRRVDVTTSTQLVAP